MGGENYKEIRPECREAFQEWQRDMVGVPGGDFGIRKKVGIMWTAHLKRKETEAVRKIAWDKILQITLALVQSGLLMFLISGGKK